MAVMTAKSVHDFIYLDLDLTGVTDCLQKPPSSMDAAAAAHAVASYRDFLWVCWYHWSNGDGDTLAAIDLDADEAWHCHMLRPVPYREACAVVFGGGTLLDHQPGGGPESKDILAACAAYQKAGLPAPANPRPECVWSVVTP